MRVKRWLRPNSRVKGEEVDGEVGGTDARVFEGFDVQPLHYHLPPWLRSPSLDPSACTQCPLSPWLHLHVTPLSPWLQSLSHSLGTHTRCPPSPWLRLCATPYTFDSVLPPPVPVLAPDAPIPLAPPLHDPLIHLYPTFFSYHSGFSLGWPNRAWAKLGHNVFKIFRA